MRPGRQDAGGEAGPFLDRVAETIIACRPLEALLHLPLALGRAIRHATVATSLRLRSLSC